MLVITLGSPPAGLFTEVVSSTAGALLVVTGASAGCFRAWAVLTERPADRVDWWTALGFLFGAAFAILVFIIDFLVGVV